MNAYIETIFQKIEAQCPDVIYLEGGYHDIDSGPNEFAINTLKDSIALSDHLIKHSQHKAKIVLGIFINDLFEPNNEYCYDDLPSNLKTIFSESKIFKKENILVFKENSTKNRGKRHLKKLSQSIDNELVIETNETETKFYVSIPNKENIYIGKSNQKSYSIFCPWIMAQHYLDITNSLKNRYHTAKDFFIIDWVEMMDKTKVLSGVEIFKQYLAPKQFNHNAISINNVFFADDSGDINQIKSMDFSHE